MNSYPETNLTDRFRKQIRNLFGHDISKKDEEILIQRMARGEFHIPEPTQSDRIESKLNNIIAILESKS